MRELITVQIGQCGLQMGTQFWQLALQEHVNHLYHSSNDSSQISSIPIFDSSMSSFFRNIDSKTNTDVVEAIQPYTRQPIPSAIQSLRARCVLVDMEERVLNTIHSSKTDSNGQSSSLSELFDVSESISSISGSGNNWAHGHIEYGQQYIEQILDSIRLQSELCDSLQAFFIMHSLGGGTGSGLGTYITQRLYDEYSDIYRFTSAVFPSIKNDDVITSPYNSILSIDQLIQYTDAVLSIDNQALINICNKSDKSSNTTNTQQTTAGVVVDAASSNHPFALMNQLCGHLLTSLTCSMRFKGSLNVDLNEISMNLVPFPKLHFLIPHLSPIKKIIELNEFTQNDKRSKPKKHELLSNNASISKSIDLMYKDIYSSSTCLLDVSPIKHTYLSCGLFSRGSITISDINRNIETIKNHQSMLSWNSEGYKIGLCSIPIDHKIIPYSCLSLVNNTSIVSTLQSLNDKFMLLFKRKAHLHHYEEYMSYNDIEAATQNVQSLCDDYNACEQNQEMHKYQNDDEFEDQVIDDDQTNQ